MPDPSSLVDLDRYPLDELDGGRARAVVAEGRRGLAERGLAELSGFLRPDAVAALVDEADALAPLAHRSRVAGTAYLAPPDEAFPPGHPRRRLWPTELGAVAYDLFPARPVCGRSTSGTRSGSWSGASSGFPPCIATPTRWAD